MIKWEWHIFCSSPLIYRYTIHPAFLENLKTIRVQSSNNAEGLITKGSTLFHTTTGLLQQLLSILVKRMIYGCVAITMRQSHYHIDSLPDGLSSLITSRAADKYLFVTQERNVLGGPTLQSLHGDNNQKYFRTSLTFSFHKLVSWWIIFSFS